MSSGISSVSSDPLRVCVCDSHGVPQCANTEFIYFNRGLHPGEQFTIPVVIVGLNYGTTMGVVHSQYIPPDNFTNIKIDSISEDGIVISSNRQCTNISYSVLSNRTSVNVTVYLTATYVDIQMVRYFIPDSYISVIASLTLHHFFSTSPFYHSHQGLYF